MFNRWILWGYFNSASCFCLPVDTPEETEGGFGRLGQLIGPNSWDFPATSWASNERWGLGTNNWNRIWSKRE